VPGRRRFGAQPYRAAVFTPERTKFLVSLAVNRSVTIPEMVNLGFGHPSTVRSMVRRCERDGLTVAMGVVTERKASSAWGARVQLNARHPAIRQLTRLLWRINDDTPVKRLKVRRTLMVGKPLRGVGAPDVGLTLGPRPRTKTLVLALLVGRLAPAVLSRQLGCVEPVARFLLRSLASAGLMTVLVKGGTPVYRLDPAFFAASELRSLLRRIAALRPHFKRRAEAALAEIERRHPHLR